MTLAALVFNTRRQCLAEAGAVLDARKISLLRAWGIVEVDVHGVTEPTLQELEEHLAKTPGLQTLSQQIDERFYGGGSHPFLQELRRLAKQLILDKQHTESRGQE
jgi:hypothetical protein